MVEKNHAELTLKKQAQLLDSERTSICYTPQTSEKNNLIMDKIDVSFTEAIKLCAIVVYDKSPNVFEKICVGVCRTTALGFVLGGKHSQYRFVFQMLYDKSIQSPEEWAKKANITVRQLYRICELHSCLTPRGAIYLFNSVNFAMKASFDKNFISELFDEDLTFLMKCIKNTLNDFGNICRHNGTKKVVDAMLLNTM